MNLDSFGTDAINGFVPNLVRGSLGLKKPEPAAIEMNGAKGLAEEANEVDGATLNGQHQPEVIKAH